MNMIKSVCLVLLILIAAVPSDAAEEKNKETSEVASANPTRSLVPSYVPPLRGAPRGRVGGGTRGHQLEHQTCMLQVMAPDHVGFTTQDQPCLYWFISGGTQFPVELTITEKGAVQPLVQEKLSGPVQDGLHGFCLADHGVWLKPGCLTIGLWPWFRTRATAPRTSSPGDRGED
jgi:hypothetical protein